MASKDELRARTEELAERVKELSCLYDISQLLIGSRWDDMGQVLQRIVDRIPAGWQHPHVTRARIRLGEMVCQTAEFEMTPWVQRRDFGTAGLAGTIEVVYLDDPTDGGGPVFLEEEGELLEAIANHLSEAALRAHAEERVRFQATLLDAVGEAVIATDPTGHVTYWNRSAERLFGWSAREAIGTSIFELTVLPDTGHEAAEVMDVLRRGESWSGELEVRRKDGSSFPAQVTDTPLLGPQGQLLGVVGVSRDLTERKAMEARVRQAQKLEAIARLAGGVAHDFNNMLTAILGNAQIMRNELRAAAEQEESLAEIEEAAGRATELTRHLLAFSRQQVMEPEVVSLGSAIQSIEPVLARLAGGHIDLTATSGTAVGRVEVDRSQLNQALTNLVSNARDAMPDGGTIRIEVDNIDVDASSPAPDEEIPAGGYVRLTVSDTGSGIDSDVLPHIFEPFFTTKSVSAGLGLSTVHGIIRQSGGHIRVDTESGRGTTVSVYLPRIDRRPAEPRVRATAATPEKSVGGETILVCEDEPAVRRLARRALGRQGYSVLEAGTGVEALELLEALSEPVDLVISDVVMPEMGGFELVSRLRQQYPDLPVLLMSGYPTREVFKDGGPQVDVPFIEKPFSFTEFVDLVDELLGRDAGRG
ncbi:MAG: ATP-binding protein [Persicimonas sp.]